MRNTLATNPMSINSDGKKLRYKTLFYSAHSFIGDHITINNNYYLLLLCKT